MMPKKLIVCLSLLSLLIMTSCNRERIYDSYQPLSNYTWTYNDVKTFPVEIKKAGEVCNIYISLRHTDAYIFNNLWVSMNMKKPDGSIESKRFPFKLAADDGRWLGFSIGDIYDNRYLVIENYIFPKSGIYEFSLRHDMRADDIEGLMDVGLSIKKVDNSGVTVAR